MQYKDNTPNGNLSFSNVKDRPNRVAKGFTKQSERWKIQGRVRISNDKHPDYNKRGNAMDVLKLTVRGTTDELLGLGMFLKKKVKKEHPIDKGYFKEVYVLSDFGKNKLKRLKNENIK